MENEMSESIGTHHAYVMGAIGEPYRWYVKCDDCKWLAEAVGPWVDVEEARRQAKAHESDPDMDRKAAEYAALWEDPNYDELNDEELEEHIDTWFDRNHEYARLREEAGESGEGERYRRLVWQAHVRATQGIRERRRRENRLLRELEKQGDSQCESERGQA